MLFFSDIDRFKWGQKWFDDRPMFEAVSLISCLLSGLVAKNRHSSMLPSTEDIVCCWPRIFFLIQRYRGIYLIIVFYEINNIWSKADCTERALFDLRLGISALAANSQDFRIQRIFARHLQAIEAVGVLCFKTIFCEISTMFSSTCLPCFLVDQNSLSNSLLFIFVRICDILSKKYYRLSIIY